jgi:hypothetical protein
MSKKERRQIGREPATHTNGGFRAGKRKRGNSLIKKAPKASAVTIKYAITDEHDNVVARFDTLTYRKPE